MNSFKKALVGIGVFSTSTVSLMAQDYSRNSNNGAAILTGIVGLIFFAVVALIAVVMIISMWKIFTKAGKPGWASIVPIYNLIVMWQITGQPVWVIILCFIPYVNVIGAIVLYVGLAKVFGKGAGFGVGLAFIPIIFFPMLAFGSDEYQG